MGFPWRKWNELVAICKYMSYGTRTPCEQPLVDAHTHVFCWGENPRDGFLSARTRRAWLTRLLLCLTSVQKEEGARLNASVTNIDNVGAGCVPSVA